MKATRR
jgi:hypothetical protein